MCVCFFFLSSVAVEHVGDDASVFLVGSKQKKQFTYNLVLNESATQREVFERSGVKDLIASAVEGNERTSSTLKIKPNFKIQLGINSFFHCQFIIFSR